MKERLNFRQLIAVASMLFGLFFGAGNLIFPVHMGQLAGANSYIAALGFIVIGAVARGVSLSMERSFFGSTGMDPFGGYGGFSDFAGSGTIWYDSAGNVISSPFGSSGMGSSGFTNPVAILGTVIIVIGVVMLIAGVILAVYLKKRGNTK